MTSPLIVWMLMTGLLVIAEVLTGSFYLLVLGACTALAGAAAFLGAPVTGQFVVFGVTAAVAVFGKVPRMLQRWFNRSPAIQASDIGAAVTVTEVGADSQFRVSYRGSEWSARLASPEPVEAGQTLRVVRVEGIELVCKKPD